MEDFIRAQQKIVPKLIKIMERRYTILRTIFHFQPIGRRAMAEKLGISERRVRNDLDFLKEQRFINSTGAGTKLTGTGEKIFYQLDSYIKIIRGLDNLETKLEKKLGLNKVYIVPTESEDTEIKQELGRFAAKFLQNKIQNGDILAVTGGTTLAALAKLMFPKQKLPEVTVVPGRGGLGEEVEIQANTIAAQIANKLEGKYHLLHVPDNLNKGLMNTIIEEPQIKKVLELVKNANILVHGIGTARVMARRRQVNQEKLNQLLEAGAVGEVFGYYFNKAGEIIYSTSSIGLQLGELKEIETVIAIAGGKEKAKAIAAVVSEEYQDILITDRQAAEEVLKIGGDP